MLFDTVIETAPRPCSHELHNPLGGGAHAVGVGPIEMNQMFVGLWDVDEHAGEKL